MSKFTTLLLLVLPLFAFNAYCQSKSNCSHPVRKEVINKPDTQVWQVTICRRAKEGFHTHTSARILISKTDGIIKVLYKDGSYQLIRLRKDVPLYLPKSEGIKPHEDINVGSTNLDLTVILLTAHS